MPNTRLPNGQIAPAQLIGERIGRVTVYAKAPGRASYGKYQQWHCRCDCGNEMIWPTYRFTRAGHTPWITLQCISCQPIGRPRVPDQGAHLNHLFANRRRAALQRGHTWELTKNEARDLFKGACHYCGAAPSNRVTHNNLSGVYMANGIDRMNSAIGYRADNVVSCCWTCNRAKGDAPYVQFMAWIDALVKYHATSASASIVTVSGPSGRSRPFCGR